MSDLSTREAARAAARGATPHNWGGEAAVARKQDELLTARELGLLLKVSAKTIYRFAWSGDLPAVRLSRKCIRFVWCDVEAWLNGRRAAG